MNKAKKKDEGNVSYVSVLMLIIYIEKPILDPEALANYRHISNFLFLLRIPQRVVRSYVIMGCSKFSNQALECIISLNDLLIASNKGLISVFVLLDLSATFDTIDHQILLQRLEHLIGIIGIALHWVKFCLSDRSVFGHVNKVLVMMFSKVLCLDRYCSPYICFL